MLRSDRVAMPVQLTAGHSIRVPGIPVGDAGKVPSEAHFVFYSQETSTDGAVADS